MDPNFDEIRVFISSTFQDMEPERAYLVRKVFPELRLHAEKRGINFIPVDLRWGITDEEARSGKVLEICLYEIDNSRPFFIGLLGDRYGWCPDEDELKNNVRLIEKWGDWLPEDVRSELSITEIEMQYGVLRNQETVIANFYIRKGSTDPRVAKLRRKIEQDGRYPVIEYSTPEELGQYVRESYLRMMNDIFPDEEIDEIGKAVAAKSAFYTSKSLYYHSTELSDKLFDLFINNACTPGQILCLTDKSGKGKSAWMVNQYLENKDTAPRELVCAFVDDGYSCGDYRKIVRILAYEICAIYGFDDNEIEDTDPNLLLATIFTRIRPERPLTVMIDGLNHLDDFGPAKGLGWLPPQPENVTYILTTLPDDRVVDVIKARNSVKAKVLITNIGTPDEDDRAQIVTEYLELFGKSLDSSGESAARIARWPLSENNFILRVLLDDLVAFGSHENIHSYLDEYLKTDSSDDFFSRLIEGYEIEFGRKRVTAALGLIAFSNSGLSEQELMDISGLRQLEWSELRNAIKPLLRTQGSLTRFSHNLLQGAIRKRYADEESTLRSQLIDYFGKVDSFRGYSELAQQYIVTGSWIQLHDLMLRYDVFYAFYNNRPYELAVLWSQLSRQKISKKRPSPSDYISLAITDSEKRIRFMLDAGNFALEYYDSYRDAENILKSALQETENVPPADRLLLANVYEAYAEILLHTSSSITESSGEMVFPYLKASLEIKKELADIPKHELAKSYELLGRVFSKQYEEKISGYCFDRAFNLFAESMGKESAECARCASIWGRTCESLYHIRTAIELKIKLTGDNHPWLVEDYKALAKALSDKDESKYAAEKAVAISSTEFGNDDRRSRAAKNYSTINNLFFKLFDFDDNHPFSGCLKAISIALLLLAIVIGLPLTFVLLWIFSGLKSAFIFGSVCIIALIIVVVISETYRTRSIMTAVKNLAIIVPFGVFIYYCSEAVNDFSNNWLPALIALILVMVPVYINAKVHVDRTERLNKRLGLDLDNAERDLKSLLEAEMSKENKA